MKRQAKKSQMILDALQQNVQSFENILPSINDERTKQNILRSIILFSCSGIDAIVKQLILESLEYVIERDEGAQEQLRKFTERKLKSNSGTDLALLANLLTAKNTRKAVTNMLKEDLSRGSLQNSEELYKVASIFNIKTDDLISSDNRTVLTEAFKARNIIVHQMDVDLKRDEIIFTEHKKEDVEKYFNTIVEVSKRFIDIVNEILEKPVTSDYIPMFMAEGGSIIINEPW